MYLESLDAKFMNQLLDLKNPLLKSFGSYKVEWVNGDFLPFLPSKAKTVGNVQALGANGKAAFSPKAHG